MALHLRDVRFHVLNLRTRMPFRYGIVSLTAAPHLIVEARVEIGGRSHTGYSAENLPPKWFTKNPQQTYSDELADMVAVIRAAADHGLQGGPAASPFAFWKNLYDAQRQWAAATAFPPLLWNFGVSLIERAVIDAFCRAISASFAAALRSGALGVTDAGDLYSELHGIALATLLPPQPLTQLIIRHTVGLTDYLTDEQIPSAERLSDGLPQSLVQNIRTYGLTHFKIKLTGDIEQDHERLRQLAPILARESSDYRFTLDGNENFPAIAPFRQFWDAISGDPRLSDLLPRLLFVEQPLHRDVALSPDVARELHAWPTRPPMIIDESDGSFGTVLAALDAGYVGTSHKNCKGIFKGIASAALLTYRNRSSAQPLILSCEDLSTVGPFALLQDFAVAATLGIPHLERNGYQYFAGLQAFPHSIQQQTCTLHPDLFSCAGPFPTLRIADGTINVASVIAAPFGSAIRPDLSGLTDLGQWNFASLGTG